MQATANFGEQYSAIREEREPGSVGQQPRRLPAKHRRDERSPPWILCVRYPRTVGREYRTELPLPVARELHGLAVWQKLDVNLPSAQEKVLADLEGHHAPVGGQAGGEGGFRQVGQLDVVRTRSDRTAADGAKQRQGRD